MFGVEVVGAVDSQFETVWCLAVCQTVFAHVELLAVVFVTANVCSLTSLEALRPDQRGKY